MKVSREDKQKGETQTVIIHIQEVDNL